MGEGGIWSIMKEQKISTKPPQMLNTPFRNVFNSCPALFDLVDKEAVVVLSSGQLRIFQSFDQRRSPPPPTQKVDKLALECKHFFQFLMTNSYPIYKEMGQRKTTM